MSRYRRVLAVLGWALSGFGPVQALSVGDAVVRSSLGQPLRVTIPVVLESSAEIESADTLRVALEPHSTYRSQGLEQVQFPPDLLKASVTSAGGGQQLLLSSHQPFLEPAGTVLLRVSLGRISIIHQLSLLLDPPLNQAKAAAAEVSVQTQPSLPDALSQAMPAPRATTPTASTRAIASELPPSAPAGKRQRLRKAPLERLMPGGVLATPPRRQALARFQLDPSFATFALLKSQGVLLEPVSAAVPRLPAKPAGLTALLPMATAEASPALADSTLGLSRPVIVTKADAESGTGFSWWYAVLAAPVFAWLLISSMRSQGGPRPLWSSSSQEPNAFRPGYLPTRPGRKAEGGDNERGAGEDFDDDAACKPAVVQALPAANQMQPTLGGESALGSLRWRVQDLSKRPLTAEVRSRLMIVEAHLDLRRIAAAIRLLEELESVSEKPRTSIRLMM